MAFPAGLLAVDIDGTLITDDGAITGRVRSALTSAADRGWEVVVASGRTYHAALPVMAQLPFVRYAAVSNGACIMDLRTDTVEHLEALSPEVSDTVVTMIRRGGAIPALYTTDVRNQQVRYDTLEGACDLFHWYITHDPRVIRVDDVRDWTADVLQIGTIAGKSLIMSIRDALAGVPASVMIMPFESAHIGGRDDRWWFCQVVAASTRKHIALKSLGGRLGIPSGRLVAVGDNYNDEEMIRHADIGIAMGNAPEEIRRVADMIVGTNNQSGLAEVVDRIIISGGFFS